MKTQSIAVSMPYVLPYEGVKPRFAASPLFVGLASSVVGKVEVGLRASFGSLSVIRADGHYVRIGDDFCLGNGATVHIAQGIYPTIVGDRVSVGQNAVVHACTIGSDCVVEANAVVLDGSVIEDRVVIEAGSVVYPRSVLKSGFIYAGSPAKPRCELEELERKQRDRRVRAELQKSDSVSVVDALRGADSPYRQNFVARTALLSGNIELKSSASVFFSCILDAAQGAIVVGANSNIQDNTRIRCDRNGVVIGQDTALGHNVEIRDCVIGARCLIGIGSSLAAGTVVEDDVMLAAGSITLEGQRLESGWLWAGRPARPLSRLDDAKRTMIRRITEQYCSYADEFRRLQSCSG